MSGPSTAERKSSLPSMGAIVGAVNENTAMTENFIEAARGDRVEEVISLLKMGQDVNAGDTSFSGGGWTALHYAAMYGKIAVVKELLDVGQAEFETTDKTGKTALHSAAIGGQTEVLKELIACGANISTKDNDGETPLYYAAMYGQNDVVRELIAEGASVETQDKDGKTPLHGAAIGGYRDAVKQLIDAGADVGSITLGHRLAVNTPLDWARQYSSKSEVVADLEACAGKGGWERYKPDWVAVDEMPPLDGTLVGKKIAYNPGTGIGWEIGEVVYEFWTPTQKTANEFNFQVEFKVEFGAPRRAKFSLSPEEYGRDGNGSVAWVVITKKKV